MAKEIYKHVENVITERTTTDFVNLSQTYYKWKHTSNSVELAGGRER